MKLTANILAFYLLLGSFLPRTDFSQLLKLHNLTQHFQLHVQEAELLGQTISVREFLWEHFVNTDSHQHGDEGNSHQNLPFHSTGNVMQFAFQSTEMLSTDVIEIFQSPLSISKNWIPVGFIAALFRPPIQ